MTEKIIKPRKHGDPSVPFLQLPGGPSMTHQSFTNESNINVIVAKYQKTGLINHTKEYAGTYGDFISSHDYHESLNAIGVAKQAFDTLPSNIRNRFENDPEKFLEFVHNPESEKEMIELGMLDREMPAEENPEPGVQASEEAQPEA